jgi:23S rRNA (uridine2552-2'-O)-methyltransferase
VVAADILEIEPIAGVEVMKVDLTSLDALDRLRAAIGGEADVVLTDMAAPTTGDRTTDRVRTAALFEVALEVAEALLTPNGAFAGKIFQGGAAPELLSRLKKEFRQVRHVKPASSRAESVELYLVALGFRGS